MARTLIVSDNFNRVDGNIGSDWLYIRETSWQVDPPKINGNKVIAAATGAHYQVTCWNGAGTFANDQYAKATVGALSHQTSAYRCGVVARCSADTDVNADFYAYNLYADGNGTYTTVLFKMVNGVSTMLNSASVAWVDGDTIEIEVEGTTVRGLKNGVVMVTAAGQTDLTTGKPGLLVAGDSILPNLDDWEGGNGAIAAPAENNPPTFSGPDIANISGTVGSPIVNANVSAKFSDTDALTFMAVGTWPAGISVTSAGVIQGTPTQTGTFSNLKVRATDTASQTVDSNAFTISTAEASGTASFTTESWTNNADSIHANTPAVWSWLPNWRIGDPVPAGAVHGSGTTGADGRLMVSGLPAGPGVLLGAVRRTGATDDDVFYQAGTAA